MILVNTIESLLNRPCDLVFQKRFYAATAQFNTIKLFFILPAVGPTNHYTLGKHEETDWGVLPYRCLGKSVNQWMKNIFILLPLFFCYS